MVEVLSLADAKRVKSFNDFKFGTSVGRFSNDGAPNTAVKGLTVMQMTMHAIAHRRCTNTVRDLVDSGRNIDSSIGEWNPRFRPTDGRFSEAGSVE